MSLNQENFYTPVYKILLVSGGLLFLFFSILYALVFFENNILINNYHILANSQNIKFGNLTEYHRLNKASSSHHIYTYKVPDNNGELHEISEDVDFNTNIRLRVGDTISVKSGQFVLFGKNVTLSRITGNKAPPADYSFILAFALAGVVFAILLLSAGVINFFNKNKYPD